MSGFFFQKIILLKREDENEKFLKGNFWASCQRNKSQMSTEYSRLEYYLLLCYVYIISINMISIIKHFSDFFEETEHFSGKMSIKVEHFSGQTKP